MSASAQSFLRWWATEKGCLTLDFVGALFLGLEYFTILLGEKRVTEVSAWLERARAWLDPKKARSLARSFTLGPVAAIALAVALTLFVWVVWIELNDPEIQKLVSASDGNLFLWVGKMLWMVMLKPLCCLGFASGVYVSRSLASAERFEGWLERIRKRIADSQEGRDLPRQMAVAAIGSMVLLIFTLGHLAGGLFMWIVFRVVEMPLRLPGFVLEQRRLRRFAAFIGLAMLTTSYLIRMTSHK